MNVKIRKSTQKFGAVVLLYLFFVITVVGQRESKNVFDVVPVSIRDALIERLKLRIEYEKTEQWGKLYDLFYPKKNNQEDYIKAKEEYIKINTDLNDPRQYIMTDFVPKVVSSANELEKESYLIEGCGTFRFKGKLIKENTIIMAHLVNKEWLFSSFGDVAPNKLCEQ
jgi:hypothetical protein